MSYWEKQSVWELIADYAAMVFIGAVVISLFILGAAVIWALLVGHL
jgi:hypothetical protein